MNSIQFVESIADWLLADPAHVVVAASAVAALTPTPDANSLAGKLYRVVDLLALNVLRAKQNALPAVSAQPASVVPGVGQIESAHTKQAGYSVLTVAAILTLAGGVLALSGCAGIQSTVAGANAQAVQTALVAGKDQLTLARELLCAAPYQSVANAMADDQALAASLPGLCPATRTVVVQGPAASTDRAAGQ